MKEYVHEWNRIAVLGRGRSLRKYMEYSHLFKKIYIVNSFDEEIQLLGEEHFVGKQVVHVVGRDPRGTIKREYYQKLGISSVQSNCFLMQNFVNKDKFSAKIGPLKVKLLPACMSGRGYPPLPWSMILKHVQEFSSKEEMCRFLEATCKDQIEEILKKHVPIRGWPTTGMLAVDLALVENELDEIHLFGYDFYAKDYLIKKNRSYQNEDWDKSKMMKYHLAELKQEFLNVKFYCGKKKTSRQEIIWKTLSEFNFSTTKVLDCGSGDGRKGAQYYIKKGFHPDMITAVDGNKKLLTILDKLGVTTFHTNLEKINLSKALTERFDVILCSEVLEHLTDKCEKKLLGSFLKLLNKDGCIIITFPLILDIVKKGKVQFPHIRQPEIKRVVEILSSLFEEFSVQEYPHGRVPKIRVMVMLIFKKKK